MLRISEIHLPLEAGEEELRKLAAERLAVPLKEIQELRLVKKSVDARKKENIHFICTVEVSLSRKEPEILITRRNRKVSETKPYRYELPVCRPLDQRPVVVGFGPAGMFAALILAQAGHRPIVLERGDDVDQRIKRVRRFWNEAALDPESNVQFGEGGAGTFSDGKLNTGIKDFRTGKILQELVNAGAPQEILWEAKPHVGTDKLSQTVKNIRKQIIALGGEIHFRTRMVELSIKNGTLSNIISEGPCGEEIWETSHVILAVGHSARDTFELLHRHSVIMEPKPFSIGARIEHLQAEINTAQYGRFANHPALGAADYKLAVHLENGRGVYTFCMCPGGTVVGAASEPNRVVTNGMSNFARDGLNANAALLVGVSPEDFESEHPLAGMQFQQKIEKTAFSLGEGGYYAPAQRVEDFLKKRPSSRFYGVEPTYAPGVTPCDLSRCLPQFIADSMRQGILLMDKRLKGFANPDAVLTGVETRSSSPVRITRNERLQSVGVTGLYPCGEGAGYAGGIISAAVDGIRCAEQILAQ